MSFILPRRLTQICPLCQRRRSDRTNRADDRRNTAGPGVDSQARSIGSLNSSATADVCRLRSCGCVRVVRGRRRSRHRRNRRWLLHRLRLRFFLALLLVGEAGLLGRRVGGRFFFFFVVSSRQPNGADCVCWSATSAAVGGAWPAVPACCAAARASSASSGACAGAEPRLLRRRGWLQRIRRLVASFEAVSGSAPAFSVAEFIVAAGSVSRGAWPKRIFSFLPGFSSGCFFLLAPLLLLCWSRGWRGCRVARRCAGLRSVAAGSRRRRRPDFSRKVCVLSRNRVRSTLAFFFGAGGTYALKLMLECNSAGVAPASTYPGLIWMKASIPHLAQIIADRRLHLAHVVRLLHVLLAHP